MKGDSNLEEEVNKMRVKQQEERETLQKQIKALESEVK